MTQTLRTRWGTLVKIGAGTEIDADVLLGYRSPRMHGRSMLSLGGGARLRSGTVLYAGSRIGRRLETGHHVVIREENRLGDGVKIWNSSTIDYGCRIGDDVKIHCNCYVAQNSRLEDNVFLAPGVILANDLYPGDPRSVQYLRGPTLGQGVQVGVNATILPYVRIGKGAIIGAGSVVTRDLPPYIVAWGNPARVHKRVKDLNARDRLAFLRKISR